MDDCKHSAQQLAILANVIAVALSENFSVAEQNLIGNVIVQIGSTILTIAAATDCCNNANSED